jgi:Cu/Ag efflux protein CusF
MKTRLLQTAAAICLAASVVSCATAPHSQMTGNQAELPPVQKSAEANRTLAFAGSIDRIDQRVGSITIVHWPLYKTFQVGPKCEVAIPGRETAMLSDFHVDDLVMVSYERVDDVLIATKIARRSEAYIRERQEQMERLEEMLYPSPNQL